LNIVSKPFPERSWVAAISKEKEAYGTYIWGVFVIEHGADIFGCRLELPESEEEAESSGRASNISRQPWLDVGDAARKRGWERR
jgi:hypothetical protein